MLNVSIYPPPAALRRTPISKPFPWGYVSVAIIFHIFIVLLLQYERDTTQGNELSNSLPVQPIQSYLVDAALFKQTSSSDNLEPEQVLEQEKTKASLPAIESTKEKNTIQKRTDEKTNQESPSAEMQKPVQPQTQADATSLPSRPPAELFKQFSGATNTGKYLENLNRNALNALSQARINEYFTNKDTVRLPDRKYEPKRFGIGRPKPARVNCDSRINKTIAVLGGIMGGQVSCSKKDDYQKYIDARLKGLPQEDILKAQPEAANPNTLKLPKYHRKIGDSNR
ncbi:hypothetical protein [Alteromonas sp. a30]|uniref:hypothetical protein n=1 Tax=Alteromonas sp. a30 TaxID=2730917 RepID=UPI00227F3154|nr:hypothetical protein [Alteromonas sp. a30]MCY7295381.1 hypothetical protein [Alteromonas sp. a30]